MAAAATGIEDLPADVLALVLRRLDGASLAALGCANAAFRALAADPAAWRALCLALWPSLLAAPAGAAKDQYRRLFADAFPLPALPPPAPAAATSLPARLVSAVDLRHRGALVLSRAVDTDAASRWFLSAPFRVDALVVRDGSITLPAPVAPAELELSWVLLDPATGRALRAATRRPVRVDRRWPTGDTVARFAVVLGDAAVLDAAVTCDERCGRVSEVSLCVEDAEGGGVSGRDGLALMAAAMAGDRVRRGDEAEAGARKRYEEFVEARAARKERRARREGIVDLCCSGVGAAAFLGFLVMLTFR
ncbi:hypothetical protein U9M48_034938 [Paspalum notatum var. saurae]|uniref:F-box domain-containing protein n=1 Tax=Paspalum notatum var. saurae TaxID=547442 RepID=A0AAQ3UEE2_PASNO